MTDSTRDKVVKAQALYTAFVQLLFPLLVGYVAYDFRRGSDHEHRITVIEASRYTVDNAREDRDALNRKLAAIREQQVADRVDLRHIRTMLEQLVRHRSEAPR